MLSSVPWGTQATLIHQDQAIAAYPFLTGVGETVAVLDTGINYNDPLLGGGFGAGKRVVAGFDYVSNDSNPLDADGHGTGVAGLLAATSFTYTDNNTGQTAQFQGIAPGVNLVALRYDDGTNNKSNAEARIKQSLDWVIANRTTYNIVGVNISNGFGFSSVSVANAVYGAELQTLAGAGVFIAAASGNSGANHPGQVQSPASDPNAYAVGSVNLSGGVSTFTDAGPLLDLLAPGENVTLPYYLPSSSSAILLDIGTGTSFSTPQITGAAALIKQVDPDFTPAQIAQILEDSGTFVLDSVTGVSYPMLNLYAAITLAYTRGGDPYGVNNTLGTATPLTFDGSGNATATGQKLLLHNDAYYKFTLSSPTQIEFSIGTDGATPPPFNLYNADGTLRAGLGTDNTLSLQAGTYYLKITAGATSMAGTYHFAAAQIAPAVNTGNNTLGTALPIALSGGQGSIGDQQSLNGEDDFYSFALTSESDTNLTVSYNGASNAPTATLLDSNGNDFLPFNGSSLDGRLNAGTYYIKISAPATLDGTFSVSISATAVVAPAQPTVGANAIFSSAAYSPDGTLHLAWYDTSHQVLDYATRSAGGTWSSVQQVDPEAGTGQYLSLAIDPSGNTGIAYYDAQDGQLRYAYNSGSGWSIQIVDTKTAGLYPSLAYTPAGTPAISYYYSRSSDLRFATFSKQAWQVSTVDSTGNVGRSSSLAQNPGTGLWSIAYEDTGHGTFKYAAQSSSGWTPQTIDSTTRGGGGSISLAFDHSNRPAFSYYDAYNADLKFAHYGSNRKWSVATVASRGTQGNYTNLSFTSRGSADILYYSKTSNSIFAAVGDIGSFTLSSVASDAGQYLVAATNPNGGRTLVFYSPVANGLDFEEG